MKLSGRQENARALAALLGIEEEDALVRLQFRVAVNFDANSPAAATIGRYVIALLERTIEHAGRLASGDYAVEVVIGAAGSATKAPLRVYAGQSQGDFVITEERLQESLDETTPLPLLVIAACYVAAAAVRLSLGATFPIRVDGPVVLSWSRLFGDEIQHLATPVHIGEAYLAGAGAVGNGFLFALGGVDVTGILHVVDPKKVTPGGLNRCLFFTNRDLGQPKATRICEIAQPRFPKLKLIPADCTLAEARTMRGKDFLIDRLVVGVDSRRVRRSLQAEIPREVFDASTTDVTEVVLHFNRQPSELACLSCIYPETERERSHEENVAEALGLSVPEVQKGFIDPLLAQKILLKYPDISADELVGRAFDTVYKELCGVGKLKDSSGIQVLAPFSFVSVLAGAYLAVEFAIRLANPNSQRFNYWRASPWHSPIAELRQIRPRDPHCEFCSKPQLRRLLQHLWNARTESEGG
jgi:molybdopterin/thiamine biosynthesis adenylyltransferase